MRYFKLIKNNNIFGVINNDNFRKYQKKYNLIVIAPDIESSEFIEYNNQFYWDGWLIPYSQDLIENKHIIIFSIKIEEIEQEEYLILQKTLQIEQQIQYQEKQQELTEQQLLQRRKQQEEEKIQQERKKISQPDETLEYVKKVKIAELKRDNQQKLKQGSTITLENGKTYSFSFDNMGLFNLITAMTTQQQSQENITFIIQKMNEFKQQCDQHCKELITYVNTLDNIVDINNVYYQEQKEI